MVKIIECPRDAMQGIRTFIPTQEKIRYLQMLLNVGFDTIDIGSFVSAKTIPQLQDTEEVIQKLDLSKTRSQLLTIVANYKGAEQAVRLPQIAFLGFPFSVSEIFQMRNTNKTIAESFTELKRIVALAKLHQKKVIAYLSMGFGNPYGEIWNETIVNQWVEKLVDLDIETISLSDTIGVANPDNIASIFSYLKTKYPTTEFGAHFHTRPEKWFEKVSVAYDNGCRRFDSAIQGFGGCPMANDALVGNLPTEKLLSFLQGKKEPLSENLLHFESSYNEASLLFSKYH